MQINTIEYEGEGCNYNIDLLINDVKKKVKNFILWIRFYNEDGFIDKEYALSTISDKPVVVMGHGIEADKVFLDSILIKCIKLKEVIIFRYDGEKDLSYNLKTGFFEKYTHNIKTEFYR